MTIPVQRWLLRISLESVILRALRRKWMLPKVKLTVRRAQVRLFKVVLSVGLIRMFATVGPFTARLSTLRTMHMEAETSLKESSIKRVHCFGSSDENYISLLLIAITLDLVLAFMLLLDIVFSFPQSPSPAPSPGCQVSGLLSLARSI